MANVFFDSLNKAIESLPYARVYQSPVDKLNYFNIEVEHTNGGDYDALMELVELAKKEGYKYDRYYEMSDFNGRYHYTAMMYVETGRVRCYFNQNGVYKVED